MEDSIKINLFHDEEALTDLRDVPVDKSLQTCLISKALVERLQARYEASSSNPSTVKSGGQTYNVIGTVKLNWHRRDSPKSHHETFSVVDSASAIVIFGRNALPKSKEPDIHPLGLERQNETQKTQQDKKKLDEQAKRAKEKQEQADREKVKQTSQSKAK